MAEQKQVDFEFEVEADEGQDTGRQTPEQIRQDQINAAKQQNKQETKEESEDGVEIVDDTPPEDLDPITGRVREPLPKEMVAELEADELEEYSDKVKNRLKQMKKVWHDERREKERALREQQAALDFAKQILNENQRLKTTLSDGERTLVDTYKTAAELEMEMAKRAYKEAYDAGDTDKVVEAQEKLASANYKLQQIKNYRPSLQQPEVVVNSQNGQQIQVPRPDAKTLAWQERNQWFGTDEEMTALALGYHQKLEKQYGSQYVGTDEYWTNVDKTMRRRFPDYFGDEEPKLTTNGGGKPVARTETKPATVVAPASRSTSSKKIVLKQSQLAIAKKLGLTPEQYAREFAKTLEN